MRILIQDENGVRALEEGFSNEEELQIFLRDYAELMPMEEISLGTPPLLCIGCEVSVDSGSQDLLYVDETALLTVVETKLANSREARRAVVGQILEYAADASSWTAADIEARAAKFLRSDKCPQEYKNLTLEQALQHFLEKTNPAALDNFSYAQFMELARANLQHGKIRLVVAIDEPPPSLLKAVNFVNRFSERFEMYLVQLKRFHDKVSKANIFVPALFGHVPPQPTDWDWGKYKAQLAWSDDDIQRAQSCLEKLQRIAAPWEPETRFHQGWIDVRCYGRVRFGVQVSRQRGLELFFWLREKPEEQPSKGVTSRLTKKMFFLAGRLETLDDDQLGRFCKATLPQSGMGLEA